MKIFNCPSCSSVMYFENTRCERCDHAVGFDCDSMDFKIVGTDQKSIGDQEIARYCENHKISICNWLVSDVQNTLCKSCSLTRKIPNKEDTENFSKWQKLESAKRRLIYQLLLLGLPIVPKTENFEDGLVFDFLSKENAEGKMTGHADGVITILLQEADSVEREQLRKQMAEPYRTLIGHFRHEIGHYYFPKLVRENTLETFRNLFGDERIDYSEALEEHYKSGPETNWSNFFISSYASSHPWEDWAETWAHYLHIMDTLETAHYAGIGLCNAESKSLEPCPNAYTLHNFEDFFNWGVRLTSAGNSLNRSMGLQDIYPFVIPAAVYKKMEFIFSLLKK